jgi:O-antigen ligase
MNSLNPLAQKNNSLFVALLLLVFLLPWPHGGEILWQYLFFAMGFFMLLALVCLKNSYSPQSPFAGLRPVKTPLLLLGAWLVYGLLQSLPLPLNVLALFTPVEFKNAVHLSELSADKTTRTLSIAPGVSLAETLKHASYVAVFMLSLLLVNNKQRLLLLLNVLFASSALIALYSVINVTTNGALSFIESIPPWTAPWSKAGHGSFSYQNHYASFLTLTIPLGFGVIYQQSQAAKRNEGVGRTRLQHLLDFLLSRSGIYFVALLVMLSALITTSSRGGNSIFIISLLLTALAVLTQQRGKKRKSVSWLKKGAYTFTALGSLLLALFLTGITDSLTNRLAKQGFTPNGRDLMHHTAVAIIKDYPLFGSGAGTYPILQHHYKSPLLGNTEMSKKAHNDYLELLANQGVIGFTLFAMAIFMLYRRLFMALKKQAKPNAMYGIQVGCFCSSTAILLHSLADFNFHLPVNTVYFFLILAIAINVKHVNKGHISP